MAQVSNICCLCKESKPLIKKSHIIPDFMYTDLYDEQHKLNRFAPADYIDGNRRIEKPSSGEYESDILCKECDGNIIGGYETYGRIALYAKENEATNGPIPEHGVTETGVPVTRITNLDYKKFKLFLLSILWRASISKRSFFKEISLGPYEEQIRKMIIEGNPGSERDFPIIMISWLRDDSFTHDFVGQPGINKATQGIRYTFPIAGITYIYHVSPNSLLPQLFPFTLFPSNIGSILYVPKGKGSELFQSYFNT